MISQRYGTGDIFLPWIFLQCWIFKILVFHHFSKKKRKKGNRAVVYSLCLWNSLLPSLPHAFYPPLPRKYGELLVVYFIIPSLEWVSANTLSLVEFPNKNRQSVLNKQPWDRKMTQKLSAGRGGCSTFSLSPHSLAVSLICKSLLLASNATEHVSNNFGSF